MNYRLSCIAVAMLISAQPLLPAETKIAIRDAQNVQAPLIAKHNTASSLRLRTALKVGGCIVVAAGVGAGVTELGFLAFSSSSNHAPVPTPDPCNPHTYGTYLEARADSCATPTCSDGFRFCYTCFPEISSYADIRAQLRTVCPGNSTIEVVKSHKGFCGIPAPICDPFNATVQEINAKCNPQNHTHALRTSESEAIQAPAAIVNKQSPQQRYAQLCAALNANRTGH